MHQGGFTPIQYDVTDKLSPSGDNFVVVKADNTRHPEDVPTINTDWWNYGGITRDVFIAETPATFIVDYKVQLAKDDPATLAGYVQLERRGQGRPNGDAEHCRSRHQANPEDRCRRPRHVQPPGQKAEAVVAAEPQAVRREPDQRRRCGARTASASAPSRRGARTFC